MSIKVLPLRLKSKKGLVLLASYLALSSLLELGLVYYGFLMPGLEDVKILGPLGLWAHIIPACVVAALVMSWIHLTRSFFYVPRARAKKRKKRRKRRVDLSRALEPLRAISSRMGPLGLALTRGFFVLLLGFCIALVFSLLTAYWSEIFYFSGSLCETSPFFSWLVSSVGGVGQALANSQYTRWLVDGLSSAAVSVSEVFRPLAKAVEAADPIYKYAFTQNLIAWSSGLSALLYRRPPIRKR